MKTVNVKITEELHMEMRLCAIKEGKSVKQFIEEAILMALEAKKEQSQ